GKLIDWDVPTKTQSRLDVARVQIEVTTWSWIDEEVEIKVTNEFFMVKMMEERFGEADMGIERLMGSEKGCRASSEGSVSESRYGEGDESEIRRVGSGGDECWSEGEEIQNSFNQRLEVG
ncbi:hypothetical protein A2U01_0061195, partial [Trifolium medium]|nr:hypothetical protein [Trifolium medium]